MVGIDICFCFGHSLLKIVANSEIFSLYAGLIVVNDFVFIMEQRLFTNSLTVRIQNISFVSVGISVNAGNNYHLYNGDPLHGWEKESETVIVFHGRAYEPCFFGM